MPTKRSRKSHVSLVRITPEAMAAFRAADMGLLQHALGLRPWQMSPLDVPKHPSRPDYIEKANWDRAALFYNELNQATR